MQTSRPTFVARTGLNRAARIGFLVALVVAPPLALSLAPSGCGRQRAPEPASIAWAQPEETTLGRQVAAHLADAPGESGFHLLEYGREALLARGTLADAAERTIDCQYYIYAPGRAGAFMTGRLLAAANRGVRVRMLLDDHSLNNDAGAAMLDAHPNIEVRLFNPVQLRARWLRLPQYLLQFNRLVRRMHNKVFAVDGCVALLGGRNIGDNYFDIALDGNSRDFDLVCAGPVAADANLVFDRFWNSPFAVPISRLTRKRSMDDLARLEGNVDQYLRSQPGYPDEYLAAATAWRSRFPTMLLRAPGEIVWEPPEKIEKASVQTAQVVVRLSSELAAVTNSVVIEAGYFVPQRDGAKHLGRLSAKGVKVSIVTLALQAADKPLVFSAYRRYREGLLRDGVTLYEYRHDAAATASRRNRKPSDSPVNMLHSKVLLLDDRLSWIGSFNLDPRSAALNTEIAVLVDSAELAGILRRHLDEAMDPTRSFAVRLEEGRLTWSGRADGTDRRWHRDPDATWWQRTRAFCYGLIPGIEGQL